MTKLPTLLDTLRERYQAWQGKIDTSGLDPVSATALRLAGNGLWLTDLLGLVSLDSEQRAETLKPLIRNDRRQRRLIWGMVALRDQYDSSSHSHCGMNT